VVITALIAAFFVLVYRLLCALENRRRDKTGTVEAFEHAYEDDLTDKKVRTPMDVLFFLLKLIHNRICNSGTLCERSNHGDLLRGNRWKHCHLVLSY
jgi:hypothetical protein